MITAELIPCELRCVPSLLVALGIIVIAVLAGGAVAIAGPAGPVGVGVLILCAAFSVRRPGLLLGAYTLIRFYKATLNPFIPVDLTVAFAVLNSAQVIWLLRSELSETQHPHNLVLQMGAEFGLLGLVLIVRLVGAGVLRRTSTVPIWSAVRLPFVFAFLTSLTSGDLYDDR